MRYALVLVSLLATVAHAQVLHTSGLVLTSSGQPLGTFSAIEEVESWSIPTFFPNGEPEVLIVVPQDVEHDPVFIYANDVFGERTDTVDTSEPVFEVAVCSAEECEVVMYLSVAGDGEALSWFRAPGQEQESYQLEQGQTLVFTPTTSPPADEMPVVHQSAE